MPDSSHENENRQEHLYSEREMSGESDFDVYPSDDESSVDSNAEYVPEITAVSNMHMINASDEEIRKNNKKWVEYAMAKLNYRPQDTRFITRHHVIVINCVRMWLLRRQSIVLIKRKGQCIPVVIKARNPAFIRVYTYGDKEEKLYHIEYNEIISDPEEVEKALKEEITEKYGITGHEPDFYVVKDFKEAEPMLELSLYQCVKPGNYFELQVAEDPHFVALVKVEKNIRGLLLVSFGEEQRWVHITDPLAHEIGWARKQTTTYGVYGQSVSYVPGYKDDFIYKATQKAVPSFVFRYNFVPLHRLRVGDILAVADSKHKNIWIGHVSETATKSEHFFHIMSGKDLHVNPNGSPVYFHIYSQKIFSIQKIRNSGIQLRIPNEVAMNTNESDLQAYRRYYSGGGRLVGDYCGPHPEFMRYVLPSWTTETKTPHFLYDSIQKYLRYIEVFRPTPAGGLQLTACLITGNKEHILRIKSSDEEEAFYMHYNDKHIYHLGTGIDMEIAVSFDPEMLDKHAKDRARENAGNAFATF